MHKRRGLRGWILSILATSPKNGAEIMESIEEMSQGWWRPSPGSIYPLLESLVQEGLIAKMKDGRYELTAQSKEEMNRFPGMPGSRPQDIGGMLNEMMGYASYFEDLIGSDRSKVDAHREEIRRIAERLNALVRGGGGNV
jgi:DNA-binding PadR family transcriptional regulator